MECKMKNISIYYEVIGSGKPIIMIHGSHVDHRLMTGCMEPLFNNRGGYKRIYIDLPGMGKTKVENWITNSDVMLDIVIDFIEKIIPNENFLLAGESYGGYLARGIVHRIANRVDGLFLLCPSIIMDFKKRSIPSHIILKRDEKLLSQLEPSEAEGFTSIQVVQSKKIWARYRDEILSGIRLADNNFLLNLQQNGYAFSVDLNRLKEKFNKPTLILLGRQDSSVGYKDAWSILDNYPRATFAVLDKAGHNLQIEQVELFNSLVTEWIVRVNDS
ncbi:alpha/beta hydrolase [Clostridium algoriphilum]|uniref:alpha/beta fold hydrolase n=1 Tax=Clostridium algoriphilum TaxID=198347 RepID=UPI001CF5C9C8|nr:alpha/beta hydrolase [Clostridium algoriphilum]MCB2294513.1 alpha/beta hydrolase [Clostridium algoriphilum]